MIQSRIRFIGSSYLAGSRNAAAMAEKPDKWKSRAKAAFLLRRLS
jgi:hypothetical protein